MNIFKVGSRIRLKRDEKRPVEWYGFIRYIGEIHVKSGTWFGIELDEPFGKNDGKVKGERYFRCDPKHGIFVTAKKIELLDENDELIDNDESFNYDSVVTSSVAEILEPNSDIKIQIDVEAQEKKKEKAKDLSKTSTVELFETLKGLSNNFFDSHDIIKELEMRFEHLILTVKKYKLQERTEERSKESLRSNKKENKMMETKTTKMARYCRELKEEMNETQNKFDQLKKENFFEKKSRQNLEKKLKNFHETKNIHNQMSCLNTQITNEMKLKTELLKKKNKKLGKILKNSFKTQRVQEFDLISLKNIVNHLKHDNFVLQIKNVKQHIPVYLQARVPIFLPKHKFNEKIHQTFSLVQYFSEQFSYILQQHKIVKDSEELFQFCLLYHYLCIKDTIEMKDYEIIRDLQSSSVSISARHISAQILFANTKIFYFSYLIFVLCNFQLKNEQRLMFQDCVINIVTFDSDITLPYFEVPALSSLKHPFDELSSLLDCLSNVVGNSETPSYLNLLHALFEQQKQEEEEEKTTKTNFISNNELILTENNQETQKLKKLLEVKEYELNLQRSVCLELKKQLSDILEKEEVDYEVF
eukprot:TRINITY_DN3216_c2_g2_i2.p1 TRINITY_DN3216_c2_g2~~TRINITY_DN3216_c2_g2_i2.p1  ORF type:complete len:586 (-),score=182.76 TRINITY_DN3216_c2_g2_i2:1916-3673(-)